MAENSYPFDGGPGAAITETQWSDMAKGWQDDGVDAPGPDSPALKVSSENVPLSLAVQPGHAVIRGFHYELTSAATVVFAANVTANSRVDRVVLRLDRIANTVAVATKAGLAAVTPVPPTLETSADVHEVSLAVYTVRSNANVVAPIDVLDAREFVSSGVQMLSASGAPGARELREGQIGYDPSAERFYARQAGGEFELGAPPNLTPYLTKTSAASTYSVLGHTHNYMSGAKSTGTLEPATGWGTHEGPTWRRVGNVVTISGTFIALNPNIAQSVAGYFPYELVPFGALPAHGIGYDMAHQEATPCFYGWTDTPNGIRGYVQILYSSGLLVGGTHMISASWVI